MFPSRRLTCVGVEGGVGIGRSVGQVVVVGGGVAASRDTPPSPGRWAWDWPVVTSVIILPLPDLPLTPA